MNISDLKKRKKALKLTTADLAYLADLPVSTVSKIMTGETKNPSYLTIERIDEVLTAEEMKRRVKAYRAALESYLVEHPEEDFDERSFQKDYKTARGLTDAPIPYSVPVDIEGKTVGNLVPYARDIITLDEFSKLDEDRFCELLDGYLIFSNAPGMRHQDIVQHLGERISGFIRDAGGKCRMYNVGINVRLGERRDTVLIPDIAVICNPDLLDENGINGAPDWIIEVVSRSTRKRDYNDKMHKYMSCGVREYWIIDPDKARVTTYIEGEPMMAYIYGFDDDIPVYIYGGDLKICINSVLADLQG